MRFCPTGRFAAALSSHFCFSEDPKHLYIFRHPVPPKGRYAIVTFAGRAAVDAKGATDERA
jgi:hypothetical protein